MIKENLPNLTYQTIAQILPRAIMLLFTFFLIRYLGSEEYGKFDFALSFAYLVAVFFELGGNILLTKYVARGYYSSFNFSLKFRITSIFIVTFFLLIIFKTFGLYENKLNLLFFAIIGIGFSSIMNLYFAFFRGVKKMNYEAYVTIIQKIIFIILTFTLFLFYSNAYVVLLSFALSMISGVVIIILIYLNKKDEYINKEKKKENVEIKSFLKDIFSLALISVFSIIYFRATQIILEYFKGFSEVGVYGASYKIIEAIINFPMILMIVLFPNFAKLAKENLKEFKINFDRIFKLLIFSGIIVTIILFFIGDYIFILFGKDYSGAGVVLKFLLIPVLALFPNTLLTQAIIALDLNIQYAIALLIVLILNFVISLLIVPIYGAIGSAISVGVCEWVISLWCYFFIRVKLKNI